MADITPTLNLIDSALGNQASQPNGQPSTQSSGSKSAAEQAMDTLQAGIDGKLKPTVSDMIDSALAGNGSKSDNGSVGDMIGAALAGKSPEPPKPYETTARSVGINALAGANENLAGALGSPVDWATGAVNLGIRGVNAVAGHPVANELGDLPGGAASIKKAMGLIHANPDAVVPQNELERIAHGVGGGAADAVLLPFGAEAAAAGKIISPQTAQVVRSAVGAPDALNATIGGVSGAVGQAASDAVPEPYKPIAGMVGGFAGGLPVVGAHATVEGARAGARAMMDRLTEEGTRRAVAKEMSAAATDPGAAREALGDQPHEIVPGSVGTTGQIAGDTGLLNWERGVRQQNPDAFNERAAEQNSARVDHLQSVQQTGDAADLPDAIRAQRDTADQRSKEIVDQLGNEHQAELAKLQEMKPNGSPSDVAQHFRDQRDALDRATQATVDNAEKNAQKYRDQIPASSAENVGAALRTPAQEARNAAKEKEKQLWNAVDPNGTLSVSMGPLQQAKNAIYGNMTKAGEADLSPKERSLTDVIDQYRPVESFRELTDLRSSISSAMREELRNSGRTPAYARLTQLRNGIESAIDSAVEGRAIQEHGAVDRGHMSIADTMTERIRKVAGGDAVAAPVETRPSLLQFLASKGGLGPDAELDAIGAHGHTVNVDNVGRRKLVRQGGWPLDYAREAAEEAGYLRGDHNGTSTVNDLLDAIDAEMRGQKRYPEGFEGQQTKREMAAQSEREQHEHDAFMRGLESDLADAGHGELGSDVKARAVHLMANEGMDADAAVETALRQLDHEADHAEIYAGPALENGGPSGKSGAGGNGAEAGSAEGSGSRASSARVEEQGVPDEEAGQRLKAASAATLKRAQTFDQGATGKLLKPGARAGEYKISDARAAATVFHPGPAGGEDIRHYITAAGGLERAAPALSDAAAISARAAAIKPDGTLDPAKLTSWAQKHAPALAELPASTRSRFENAANAERAISEAMATRRDAIENFNKSEAAKIAGLSEDGDIVRHVGSIVDQKNGAQKMADLANAAKGKPAATEGLKRAVVENIFNRFLPEGRVEQMKSFIGERSDVLGKVFDSKELSELTGQMEKAGHAGAKAGQGAKLRRCRRRVGRN